MKMEKESYQNKDWIIGRIAADFELHDCWQIPVKLRPDDEAFFEFFQFLINFNPAQINPVVALLFKIRTVVGSAMGWDGPQAWGTIPNSTEQSISERLTDNDVSRNQTHRLKRPADMMSEFKPVFLFDKEGLLEISNRTIYALLHLGITDEGKVALGVYIKSRGRMSDLYMTAIKPFRYTLVYPYWFDALISAWHKQKKV